MDFGTYFVVGDVETCLVGVVQLGIEQDSLYLGYFVLYFAEQVFLIFVYALHHYHVLILDYQSRCIKSLSRFESRNNHSLCLNNLLNHFLEHLWFAITQSCQHFILSLYGFTSWIDEIIFFIAKFSLFCVSMAERKLRT